MLNEDAEKDAAYAYIDNASVGLARHELLVRSVLGINATQFRWLVALIASEAAVDQATAEDNA